jgi:hypothetical protein
MTYTEAEVFANQKHNTIVDLMYFHLVDWSRTQDPEPNIDLIFCLTGKAAAIWQGATNTPINNAVFITDNAECFQFVLDKLGALLKLPTIKYQEKVLMYTDDLFIEVHYWTGAFTPYYVDFISVHPTAEIPPQFL